MSNATTPPLPPNASPAPAPGPSEPPASRAWMARRFLLGGLGVVALAAAASATFALNEVGKIVEALGQTRAANINPAVLAPTVRGAPETLLLVGNDQRPPPKGNPFGSVQPHSNEMLLVRIDPSKPTVSMLSIPRELQVSIHPHGRPPVLNRINSAYTFGGIQLMTETIKQVLRVSVNHVFVVTFPKFKRAVNEMGCVYGTVDRRYYHVNEPGGEQYFEINLQPGYQRLCGRQALEFVANRHEDTSITRDARDQRFLLEVKNEYGASLFEERGKFERILGRAVETDLHGSSQVLDLLELLTGAQSKPVRQVPFHVTLGPTYDTATRTQIDEAVESFLRGTAAINKNHSLSSSSHAAARPRRGHVPSRSRASGLTPTPSASIVQARAVAPDLPFPLEYPRIASTYTGAAPETLRRYDIRDPRGRLEPIYDIAVNSGPLGRLLRRPGHDVGEPAPARQPRPDDSRGLAHLRRLLHRRTGARDRVARRQRDLLGAEHAHEQRQPASAARDRGRDTTRARGLRQRRLHRHNLGELQTAAPSHGHDKSRHQAGRSARLREPRRPGGARMGGARSRAPAAGAAQANRRSDRAGGTPASDAHGELADRRAGCCRGAGRDP